MHLRAKDAGKHQKLEEARKGSSWWVSEEVCRWAVRDLQLDNIAAHVPTPGPSHARGRWSSWREGPQCLEGFQGGPNSCLEGPCKAHDFIMKASRGAEPETVLVQGIHRRGARKRKLRMWFQEKSSLSLTRRGALEHNLSHRGASPQKARGSVSSQNLQQLGMRAAQGNSSRSVPGIGILTLSPTGRAQAVPVCTVCSPGDERRRGIGGEWEQGRGDPHLFTGQEVPSGHLILGTMQSPTAELLQGCLRALTNHRCWTGLSAQPLHGAPHHTPLRIPLSPLPPELPHCSPRRAPGLSPTSPHHVFASGSDQQRREVEEEGSTFSWSP
ncbi:hypothetical protein Cadr_000017481 [Camelus dromedarius]|uniref:Uncharacterized protein n=1 Tax=Camelus dromedarius TaxID=9838 RepID=A0A5N4DHG1_CAMDR|nr:hypothetical protein Cadr_000017481 [Camelus dromedarius]